VPESAASAARAALDLVSADPRRAATRAARALDLARKRHDREAESMAHRALGLAARELGDLEVALAELRTSVRVAVAAGLADAAAQARMSRAFVLLTQGRIRAALRDAEAAVASMHGVDRARALAQHGLILQRSGFLDDALAVYATALPALRRHRDRLWEARLRNNRAILHAYQGHSQRAKADITAAEQLYEALRLPRAQAGARWNLGVIEGKRGDIPAALAALDGAAEAYRKASLPMAPLLLDRCEVLLSAGLAEEALRTVTAAVAELSGRRQAVDLAEAHLLLARAQLAAGSPAQAAASAAAARRGFARQHRPGWAAEALYVEVHAAWAAGERSGRLLRSARNAAARLDAAGWSTGALDIRLLTARIATDLGRLELARTQLREAASARRSAQFERRAQAWHALALLRMQTGDRRGAYAAVSAGLTAARRYQALLGATELRLLVAGQVSELAALGVALAIETGNAERVFWSAERYRASTLRIRPVLPPADERLADLRSRLRAAADETEQARLAGRPVQSVSRRQHALEEELRQRLRHSRGDPTGLPSARASDVTDALEDRVFVEYVECADALYAIVLGSGRPSLRPLGPLEPVMLELDTLRFAWHRVLIQHGSAASLRAAQQLAESAAERLDRALLAPLSGLLGNRPLVLAPTGSLRSLPWPMLPSCLGRTVTIAPSASTWLTARQAAERDTGTRALLVSGPGLPNALAEVGSLSSLYPRAQLLTGADATVSGTLFALDGADVAHVAAHGSFRADNPLFSSLLLADGPLTVCDLERLNRAPRAIMLAACDSALSPARPGDEMTGLAAALLAVGASTVVAPLLPLPDEAAPRLACGWHRLVSQGCGPAAALAAVATEAAEDGPAARLAATTLVCLGYGG
jgi:CHAT domain-containing protein